MERRDSAGIGVEEEASVVTAVQVLKVVLWLSSPFFQMPKGLLL